MKIGKTNLGIAKVLEYLAIFSPVILSSLFIYGSRYPVWANSLYLSLFVLLIISLINLFKLREKKNTNLLSLSLVGLGVLFAVLYMFISSQKNSFDFFGKGVSQWTSVSIMGLFVASAYFYSLRGRKNKLAIIISGIAVLYTVVNFLLVNYLPSVANITGYINVPMLSFGSLLNYPFIFSLVVLIASLVSHFLNKYFDKKGIVLTEIGNKLVYLLYILVPALIFINIILYGFRYVGASYYIKAAESVQKADIDGAKDNINKAITTAPFDTYYLGRIELLNYDINQLLNSTSTDKAALEQKYKELVEYQIGDAKKAIDYDDKNPANYLALGLAYERAMLLAKDDAYKLAVDAYEKARSLASDKDYVDVLKAKLAFSANKEEDALTSLDRALKFNASSAPALFISSQYYDLKNKLDTALSYGEKAVMASPYAGDARMHLGLLYLKAKNYDEAVKMFITVYNLSGNKDNSALYYAAAAYKLKGDRQNFDMVIAELEKNMGTNVKEIQDLKSAGFGGEAPATPASTPNTPKKK